jgi:hypothetical protein
LTPPQGLAVVACSFDGGFMRLLLLAALLVPLSASVASGNKGSGFETKIVIKDEIRTKCGGFPYAPTIVVDAKLATVEEMKNTRESVMIFLKQVESYEKCLITLGKSLDGKMSEQDGDFIIKVINRALDERDALAIDFNNLVDSYNAANGIKPADSKPAAKPAAAPAGKAAPATTKPAAAAKTTAPAAKTKTP